MQSKLETMPIPERWINEIKELIPTLLTGQPIAIIAPPHFRTRDFSRRLTYMARKADRFFPIEVILDRYAHHESPLSVIFDTILTQLSISDVEVRTEDQFLTTLEQIVDERERLLLSFRVLDALPLSHRIRMANVVRLIGESRKLRGRVMTIVSGHERLHELVHESPAGVSPLNTAHLVKLLPFSKDDIQDIIIKSPEDIRRVLDYFDGSFSLELWKVTGGHPGLVRRVFELLSSGAANSDVLQSPAFLDYEYPYRVIRQLMLQADLGTALFQYLQNPEYHASWSVRRRLCLSGAFTGNHKLSFCGDIFRKAAEDFFDERGLRSGMSMDTDKSEVNLERIKQFAEFRFKEFAFDSFDGAMQQAMADLDAVLPSSVAVVFAVDPIKDLLILEYCTGRDATIVDPVPIDNKSYVGQVAKNRRPIFSTRSS